MNVTDTKSGIYGGLAGGLIFGAMMAFMGTLPMIGRMVVGQPSAIIGFIAHMIISASIGASFAIFLGLLGRSVRGLAEGLRWGLAYGGAWWFLGPLTLMPLFMGMGFGVNWNATAAANMLPSLGGHLVYGAILGLTYSWLRNRVMAHTSSDRELRSAHQA
jgi:hypothetical protein